MRHLLHHAAETRGIGPLHHLVELPQAQAFHHPPGLLRSADDAAHQLDFDCAAHQSFSTAMPRNAARAALSRNDSSATMVALTTLCGLRRPIDLVSTLGTPQAVITARTAPPAITPVPWGAGFNSTWELENLPSTWCAMVVSSTCTRRRFFLAASMPLRMAEGTSLAFPTP